MTYVEYEQEGHLVTIRMNRPERGNSFGAQMKEDLADAWDRFNADDSAWVAIFTGTGKAFCSGNDLKEAKERGTFRAPHRLNYQPLSKTKPTVAAVNGYAIGVGFVFVLNCDIRIAADTARFQLTEVALGGIGGWDLGIRERLPIGVSNEITLLGSSISSQRAYELGMLSRVVPGPDLMTTAREYADRLLDMPPEAVRVMKSIMLTEAPLPSERGEAINREARPRLALMEDTTEAVRAFNEKRRPNFTGR